jgi:hypothetical protein
MKLEQQVAELSKLIDERESVIKVKEVAANMTSSYADIKISTNAGMGYSVLSDVLNLSELMIIAKFIQEQLSIKQLKIEEHLYSHVISKKL